MGIRRKRLLSAVLSAVVVVLAMSGAGIAASASPVSGPDFSTSQGIDHYLQSRGVNPAAAIRQAGLKNYVGNSCPGAGWHCIAPTHTPVVQIAPAGGVNVFNCSPATGSGSCFVLQISAGAPTTTAGDPPPVTNKYICNERTSANPAGLDSTADCGPVVQSNTNGNNQATIAQTITQQSAGGTSQSAMETAGSQSSPLSQTNMSGNNLITIAQSSIQNSSDTPTAAQTIYVSQVNGTGQNQASISQQVQQHVSDAASKQDQEGTQIACVTQDSPSGPNLATMGQLMNQNEQSSASGISQVQNGKPGPFSSCGADESNTTTINPNLAAFVLQNQVDTGGKGQNQLTDKQSLVQQEQSSNSSATGSQLQGPSGDVGGQEAIPAETSSALSTANTSQNEQQNMQASSTAVSQTQNDPMHQPTGEGFQAGNANDTFTLTQTGVQQADLAGQPNSAAQQHYDILGDCVSPGTCNVQSTATTNGMTHPSSCTSSPESGRCTAGVASEEPPPCNAGDSNVAYNAMPKDVVDCLNPAIGFEAQSASEFGNAVTLAPGTGRNIGTLNVDFQSFACQTGHWNGVPGDTTTPEPCAVTDPSHPTFQWPITANIYSADSSGNPGALLATDTETQTIPYRPGADSTGHCTGSVANKWWNPDAIGGGACQNSIGTVLTFSNFTAPGGGTPTALPDNVIWTVAFDTSTAGYHPVGTGNPCNSGLSDSRFPGLADGGCPYDSLNVGDNGNTGGVDFPSSSISGAPYAGSDFLTGGAVLYSSLPSAYGDGGSAGVLRLAKSGWNGLRPLGEIITTSS